MDRRNSFRNKAQKYENKTLAECRLYVDTLLDDVQKFRTNEFSKLYRCRLGRKQIAIDAYIAPCPQLESGVLKIERNEKSSMTDGENQRVQICC